VDEPRARDPETVAYDEADRVVAERVVKAPVLGVVDPIVPGIAQVPPKS